jgi:transposase
MEHVAIDLGGRQSQVCIRSSSGEVLKEARIATQEIGTFLMDRPHSRVIVETCAESFRIADQVLELGHEVRVVPATLARSLGVGARRTKTDRRDAQALSEASCRLDLPSVHIPSERSRQIKALCGMRDGLVGARTKLVNNVRGWARTQGIALKNGGVEMFPTKVRAILGEAPKYVSRQLRAIELLTEEIDEADSDLAELTKKDPVCCRLKTVPGVGNVTALRFLSSLDVISRFAGAHDVASFIGLTPGENSSSEKKQRTSITKAGPATLRWALVQAAWSARRTRKDDPMVRWAQEIEKRRGKCIAVTALARKMAGILFAIWRDGSVYEARRGAEAQG